MKIITHTPIAIMFFFAVGCNHHQKQRKMEIPVKGELTETTTAFSKDGTTIAYEKTGNGACIILVNGALAYRKLNGEKDLAGMLAKKFTVIFYDRRGRGESSDTKPYSVEREIEDIETLIDVAGGSVYLFGSSGGAALALLTAEKLGPGKVTKLALYEPPYGSDNIQEFAKEKNTVNKLIEAGKPADAVTFFMEKRGTPPDKLEGMKKSPEWNGLVTIGHTLVYDFEVLGDGTVPIEVAKKITIPVLVMDGEKSLDFVHETLDTVKKIIPGAIRKTIKDQTHEASPDALAPLLREFFSME